MLRRARPGRSCVCIGCLPRLVLLAGADRAGLTATRRPRHPQFNVFGITVFIFLIQHIFRSGSMLPISIMLKLFGSTCLAGGFLYHEQKNGLSAVLITTLFCSLRQVANALGTQCLLHRDTVFNDGDTLKIRAESPVRRALGKAFGVSESCRFAAYFTFCHFM